MICEVTGVDILTDKPHSWYKPNKGNIERLLRLGKHAPPRPASVGGTSSGSPSVGVLDRQPTKGSTRSR
jgi:hypothetical protein